jgi:hypothetical protein
VDAEHPRLADGAVKRVCLALRAGLANEAEEFGAGATVRRAPDGFRPIDLPFGLAVAPRLQTALRTAPISCRNAMAKRRIAQMPDCCASLSRSSRSHEREWRAFANSDSLPWLEVRHGLASNTDAHPALRAFDFASRGKGQSPSRVDQKAPQPLLRKPAEMPFIVSWMPVNTLSLDERPRCSLSSSTCTWFSGSR